MYGRTSPGAWSPRDLPIPSHPSTRLATPTAPWTRVNPAPSFPVAEKGESRCPSVKDYRSDGRHAASAVIADPVTSRGPGFPNDDFVLYASSHLLTSGRDRRVGYVGQFGEGRGYRCLCLSVGVFLGASMIHVNERQARDGRNHAFPVWWTSCSS